MSAKIELRLHGELVAEVALTRERMFIGRGAASDIRIDSAHVSEKHAIIVTTDNRCVLSDLGSDAGTLVDGIDVDEHVLEHADVIAIGDHELIFIDDDEAFGSVQDDSVFDLAPIDEDAYVEVDAPLAIVQALDGIGRGRKLKLANARTALGIPGVQVVMITRGLTGYLLKGAKGTRPVVNGTRAAESPYKLQDNDVIELAGNRLRFTLLK